MLHRTQTIARSPRRVARATPARAGPASSVSSSTTVSRSPVASVEGVRDVLLGSDGSRYKAVLLDQFGVLHDGRVAYPGAQATVQELHTAGVAVYVLSNSSRRSSGTINKLAKLGFREEWFAGAVTSGELAHQCLAQRPSDWWRTLGRRVLHITWSSRGLVNLDELNLEVVDGPEDQPDFILAHGTEALGSAWGRPVRPMDLARMRQVLVRCADAARITGRPLPMVVANPDLVTVDGADLIVMPGTLAKEYASLGGQVVLMGKPDPIIYRAALDALGLAGQERQVLAIGDSLEHDVAGAAAAGMDTLFIAGGIHAGELGIKTEESALDMGMLDTLCETHRATPQFVCPFLKW